MEPESYSRAPGELGSTVRNMMSSLLVPFLAVLSGCRCWCCVMKTGDHLPNQESSVATLVIVLVGPKPLLRLEDSFAVFPEWTSQPEAEETDVASERMHLLSDSWTMASGVS